MAGDWIKMRTDLYRDPKVCAIADQLMRADGALAEYVDQNCQRKMTVTRNVMRNVTVGALVSVWGVMRQRGKRIDDDLVFKSGTLWIIDDLAELPGFGQAMAAVGWVEADAEGLVFRNFFSEYNVDPNEDAKAKNAERQRRFREKSRQERNVTVGVTVASQNNTREEKRREEKRDITEVISPEGASVATSPPGTVCKAMRQAGIADVNPSNPRLLALLSAGAEVVEFMHAADKAASLGKGFAYALGIVEGERRRAAEVSSTLHRGPMTPAETNYQRAMRERAQEAVPAIAARAPGEPYVDAADFFTGIANQRRQAAIEVKALEVRP